MAVGSGAQPQADATEGTAQADFTMEFVPKIPGGRALAPLETEGAFAFAVADGAMTQQCLDEMVCHLRAIVGGGSWLQQWPSLDAETDVSADPEWERSHAEPPPVAAEFDMEFRPTLPDGAAIMPEESPGRFVWLVRAGAMTQQCFDELRAYLLAIVGSGKWTQNWDGDGAPHPGH
ncbi:hypothetical protein [Streptomyces sp. NPDC050264]|uniref:hypothetical protein n=1 Tax=Streptomyces sp. NPDC050264 TaxID=3155038 RepID=UPI00342E5148